ncbi:unnamed protein product [Adineta ricciae]|uniref:Uncharacterized protein n=1 Tax=Adineta ricciae TaxID=249248 RepID=A0A813ZWA6_ADIRI|nr:unnamed protein product [Adineta ricciae]CAF1498044.1 unnamed protein product [Adineta ricciae]
MLAAAAAANLAAGGDSSMPGNYEPFLGGPPRNGPLSNPLMPPRKTPIPQLNTPRPTIAPPIGGLPTRTPFGRLPPASGLPMRGPRVRPLDHPIRVRRHRRRPLTPEIVVERRSRHHSSFGRRRVITVPLDCRPTLGLRGPPSRVLEIERVRCFRSRRCRSPCYDYEYDDHDYSAPSLPPPAQQPPPQPQPITFVANPIPNPCLSFSNHTNVTATSALLTNLTPEILQSLPKQTVRLDPIYLPGSHADANTELHTVRFPTEIINPITGALSIIQANPSANVVGIASIPNNVTATMTNNASVAPARPPLLSSTAVNPTMQRFRELFQRLSLPKTQPMGPTAVPRISGFNPTNNTVPNPPTNLPSVNSLNENRSPSVGDRPVNSVSNESYQPPSISPYRTTTFTPSRSANNMSYRPINNTLPNSSNVGPYRPANITPYNRTSTNQYLSVNRPTQPSFTSGATPYASTASITPTNSFTSPPDPPRNDSNYQDIYSSSPSLPMSSFQPTNSMPKSILRNGPSANLSSTTNTRSNSPNTFPANETVQKTTRFV